MTGARREPGPRSFCPAALAPCEDRSDVTAFMKTPAIVLVISAIIVQPARAQCADGSPPPCRTAARSAPAPANSIAVLYFDNLSRDSTDTNLADGFSEEVISRLS